RVEDPKPRVRQPDRVGVRRREALEAPHGVVARVPDRSSGEGRKVVSPAHVLVARQRLERGEWIPVTARDLARGGRSEERPARDTGSAFHRFEQEAGPGSGEESPHERDGGREVGGAPAHDEGGGGAPRVFFFGGPPRAGGVVA